MLYAKLNYCPGICLTRMKYEPRSTSVMICC